MEKCNRSFPYVLSEEESRDLNTRVKLSGLTKQDYIIKCLLEQDIVIQGNPRVFKALRNQMTEILTELRRIENSSEVSDERRNNYGQEKPSSYKVALYIPNFISLNTVMGS